MANQLYDFEILDECREIGRSDDSSQLNPWDKAICCDHYRLFMVIRIISKLISQAERVGAELERVGAELAELPVHLLTWVLVPCLVLCLC